MLLFTGGLSFRESQQTNYNSRQTEENMRHLMNALDLSVEEINRLIALAETIIENPTRYAEVCKGKKLATCFYEPSTRTRLSFESAMINLGGQVLGFSSADSSSAAKGESVSDTIRVISSYADICAMRHPKEGAPLVASLHSSIPVINAGDGGHNHPTQTLTDLLTIKNLKGRLDNLTIGLCGDLKFGRTVHSLIGAMVRYPNVKFVLISPEELKIPDYLRKDTLDANHIDYKEVTVLEDVLPELDLLYMTRVQRERFFNEEDYIRLKDSFILDRKKMKLAREDMLVLHPLPRVNEISTDVDDDPRAVYFKQAQYGVFIRMALIMTLLEVVPSC
jgi:aspartate carbamoyltransferase catalytic subunit